MRVHAAPHATAWYDAHMHGGDIVANELAHAGIRHLFVLCGGHISPILTGAAARGLRVVDVRDEASAVFAADAMARATGTVGAVAVTAGPGVTNTITAVKNAQLAQTPLLVLGGATATLLRGRGALQDIDQLALMAPCTKWATRVTTVPGLAATLQRALAVAQGGVPGPVFVEIPVDLLYPEDVVRSWYAKETAQRDSLKAQAQALYVKAHLLRQFKGPRLVRPALPLRSTPRPAAAIAAAAAAISRAARPMVLVGTQALAGSMDASRVARALTALGLPVYLAGAARGLLGRDADIQFRHARSTALREADCVLMCGLPFDFRVGYGRGLARGACVINANLDATELIQNRRPHIAAHMHAGEFVVALAHAMGAAARPQLAPWFAALRANEAAREREIATQVRATGPRVDPLFLAARIEALMSQDACLVVDGGDFVATASYLVRPRAPRAWLDPGVFGTLGVGGGFALGAALAYPKRQVWLLWGDGSAGYSLAEFDTFVRHGVAPIAIIGNDASWSQIAREQVAVLDSALGTTLRHTDYHRVAEGYGGVGLLLDNPAQVDATLQQGIAIAASGRPVCVNVHLQASSFRAGAISL